MLPFDGSFWIFLFQYYIACLKVVMAKSSEETPTDTCEDLYELHYIWHKYRPGNAVDPETTPDFLIKLSGCRKNYKLDDKTKVYVAAKTSPPKSNSMYADTTKYPVVDCYMKAMDFEVSGQYSFYKLSPLIPFGRFVGDYHRGLDQISWLCG